MLVIGVGSWKLEQKKQNYKVSVKRGTFRIKDEDDQVNP